MIHAIVVLGGVYTVFAFGYFTRQMETDPGEKLDFAAPFKGLMGVFKV